MKAPFLIGRLLFAGFFINSGISHLQNRKSMAGYARAKGVPAPELAVTLAAVPLLVACQPAAWCQAQAGSHGPPRFPGWSFSHHRSFAEHSEILSHFDALDPLGGEPGPTSRPGGPRAGSTTTRRATRQRS